VIRLTDPEYFLLAQDIYWRMTSSPAWTKFDSGSLETACDCAFVAAHVFFKRKGEEQARLAAMERSALRDQLAHEIASNQKNVPGPKNDERSPKRRRQGG
jgi:hypothetical protein